MKILFINPPIRTQLPPYMYPIGMCYIASYLREHGHQVKILDVNGYRITRDQFKQTLATENFDAIGLGGLITTFNHIDWISAYIKDCYPNIPIFAGNTVASTIPNILLNNTHVDIVVNGEGEETCLDLVNTLDKTDSIGNVPGITYKDPNGKIIQNPPRLPIEDLDSLPFPAWDLIPMDIYLKNNEILTGVRSALISTIRGCPYNCRFCCKTFIGYKVRSRTPENIIRELKLLVQTYKIKGFLPGDDLFIYNRARVERFCDLIMEEKLNYLQWSASARANLLTKELAEKMKASGCIRFDFGFESNCQRILDYYNKKLTVGEQQKALDICKSVNIPFHVSYIVGARNEDVESQKECEAFCKKNGYQYYPENLLMPLPGTPVYEECRERGIIKDELEFIRKLAHAGDSTNFIVNCTDSLTDHELIVLFNKYRKTPIKNKIRNYFGIPERIQQNIQDYGICRSFNTYIRKIKSTKILADNSGDNEGSNQWN